MQAKSIATPIMEITKTGRPTWGYSASGKTLIPSTAVFFDWTKIHRVLIRIACGLYWVHWNKRVPTTHDVTVIRDTEWKNEWSTEKRERFSEDILNLLGYERFNVQLNTFSYAFRIGPTDQAAGMFVLVFFRRVHFLVQVIPPKSEGHLAYSVPPEWPV